MYKKLGHWRKYWHMDTEINIKLYTVFSLVFSHAIFLFIYLYMYSFICRFQNLWHESTFPFMTMWILYSHIKRNGSNYIKAQTVKHTKLCNIALTTLREYDKIFSMFNLSSWHHLCEAIVFQMYNQVLLQCSPKVTCDYF